MILWLLRALLVIFLNSYVYALTGHGTKAVDYFHKALGLRREDTFSTTMLGYVMEQMLNEMTPEGTVNKTNK